MKLTVQERAAREEAFRRMNAAEKLDYILTYYKLPLILTLLFVYAVCYGTYRHVSRKEVLLYVACINVTVGEDMENTLSEGFVHFSGEDSRKSEVYVYHDLYLSNDPALSNHEYAYASRLKLLAAVDAEQLDVVLMNQEAYNLLSGNGYLLELSPRLFGSNPELYQRIQPFLVENDVILEDNALEYHLNEAENYRAVTVREVNSMVISRFPRFQNADFSGDIFLGIIPNSPRLASATEYIAYLASDLP